MTGLETVIGLLGLGVFGNPLFIGFFMLIFFVALGLAFYLSFEAMLVFLIPALFLAFSFIPILQPIIAIIIGFVIFLAFIKLVRR